ncbi:carboxymuconolactone decarboxylase family protein [Parvibaculum sp.]|jgi:AhpD family alkylhydroperoxidase|uniref:carboxymuconolactone decarboxylase family protein n=1 Tax=Parvibaculum sp. TaxID=2024848 RepID=UPI002FDAC253
MSTDLTPRMNPYKAAPAAYKPLIELQAYTDQCGLEPSLLELVKTRASQINGCAFCLEMHTREARAAGESEARLYLLNAWHESPLYTDRERAALAWTEAVTLVSETGVPDAAWKAVSAAFSEQEIANLTVAIGMINVWNRLAVSFRSLHPVTEEQQRKTA